MIKTKVAKNKIVRFGYTITEENGDTIYAGEGLMTLIYLHGYGNIIPGLEKSLAGMRIGEKKRVKVVPEEAYGHIKKSLIVKEKINEFTKNNASPKVGNTIQYRVNSKIHDMKITDIKNELVTLDGNHPLAGEILIYDVKIISVSDASEIEKAYGYPITGALNTCCAKEDCC